VLVSILIGTTSSKGAHRREKRRWEKPNQPSARRIYSKRPEPDHDPSNTGRNSRDDTGGATCPTAAAPVCRIPAARAHEPARRPPPAGTAHHPTHRTPRNVLPIDGTRAAYFNHGPPPALALALARGQGKLPPARRCSLPEPDPAGLAATPSASLPLFMIPDRCVMSIRCQRHKASVLYINMTGSRTHGRAPVPVTNPHSP
jgi:hypothetical protein